MDDAGYLEVLVPVRAWGFKSPLPHNIRCLGAPCTGVPGTSFTFGLGLEVLGGVEFEVSEDLATWGDAAYDSQLLLAPDGDQASPTTAFGDRARTAHANNHSTNATRP